MSAQRAQPLITLVLTEDGEVEVEPGPAFADEHVETLIGVSQAVQQYLRNHRN